MYLHFMILFKDGDWFFVDGVVKKNRCFVKLMC